MQDLKGHMRNFAQSAETGVRLTGANVSAVENRRTYVEMIAPYKLRMCACSAKYEYICYCAAVGLTLSV